MAIARSARRAPHGFGASGINLAAPCPGYLTNGLSTPVYGQSDQTLRLAALGPILIVRVHAQRAGRLTSVFLRLMIGLSGTGDQFDLSMDKKPVAPAGIVIAAIILILRRRQGGPILERSMKNPKFRVAGGVLIAVGLGWLILASQMGVSVSSCDTDISGIGDFGERLDAASRGMRCLLEEREGSRPRVINIGLLSEKNNSLLLAGLTALAGVILLAVSFNRGRTNSEAPKPIEGRGLTAAADAWRETQASLQPEQYNDFLEAFRGTPEALLAAKHKRILQDWDALNKADDAAVEAFLTNDLFPAMKQRVRKFINDEAGNNSSLGELNQRLLHQEAAADRIAREEADRAEAARLEQLRREEAEKIEQARREKQKQAKVVRRGAIGIAVAVAVIAAIGVSQSILSWWNYKRFAHSGGALSALAPGATFQDCASGSEDCPVMVVVPGGSFLMGSPDSEGVSDERPQRRISVARLAVSQAEITFAEWDMCAANGGCRSQTRPDDATWGRGRQPVINVSWDDAQEYVRWLSEMTGATYRLLSEAEWEYAARAGTTTAFSFGNEYASADAYAWFEGNSDGRAHPVREKKPNAFGLHDMQGNVWEWVEDCYSGYDPAKRDSMPVTTDDPSAATATCSNRVIRGGSWNLNRQYLRSALRIRYVPSNRNYFLGFRVARTL